MSEIRANASMGRNVIPENIPFELKQLDQWVCWKLESRAGHNDKSKMTKVPYCAFDGTRASSTDPRTWTSFSEAIRAVTEFGFNGVGFVLTENDPYVGIDLDDAVDENGEIRSEQADLLNKLDSYTERSQSGKGFHVIVRGGTPNGDSMNKRDALGPGQGLEIYFAKRFWVVTGDRISMFPEGIEERTSQVKELFMRFKPTKEAKLENFPESLPPLMSDETLIQKAMQANNGEKFSQLWEGDISGYGSHSEADMALCNLLAFWTKDAGQIDRLFRKSKLCRTKWDEWHGKETYGQGTIRKALSGVGETYSGSFGGSRRSLTDVGNAERLVLRHGDTLKFCDALGGWHIWDGIRWKQDKECRALALAKDTVKEIYREAAEEPEEGERKNLASHARKSENVQRIRAMLELAKPDLAIKPEKLDANPMTLNCPNGLVDLRNGDLLKHAPEDLVSKVTGAEYEPEADRSTWERFLTEVFDGNEDLIRYLQKAIGYSLSGDTREQCFHILHGEGANGKSTFLEALADALGEYAGTAAPETFLASNQPRNIGDDIAALKGRRMVFTSETGKGRKWDESRIKQLSGGDTLTCRKLHCDYFTYKPTWKIWMATNNKPRFEASDYALFRRIRLIPFEVTFPPERQDKGLLEKLKGEAAGILAWAVEGALLWQNEGLECPEVVRVATENYRDEQDSLKRFLEEECVKSDRVKVLAKTFKENYAEWCRENGESRIPDREIGKHLKRLGFSRVKSNGSWHYLGLSLNPSDVGTLSDVDFESPYEKKYQGNNTEITSLNVTTPLGTSGVINLEEE